MNEINMKGCKAASHILSSIMIRNVESIRKYSKPTNTDNDNLDKCIKRYSHGLVDKSEFTEDEWDDINGSIENWGKDLWWNVKR